MDTLPTAREDIEALAAELDEQAELAEISAQHSRQRAENLRTAIRDLDGTPIPGDVPFGTSTQ